MKKSDPPLIILIFSFAFVVVVVFKVRVSEETKKQRTPSLGKSGGPEWKKIFTMIQT